MRPKPGGCGIHQCAVLRALSLPKSSSDQYFIHTHRHSSFTITETPLSCVRFEVFVVVISSSGMQCSVVWYISTEMSVLTYHTTVSNPIRPYHHYHHHHHCYLCYNTPYLKQLAVFFFRSLSSVQSPEDGAKVAVENTLF